MFFRFTGFFSQERVAQEAFASCEWDLRFRTCMVKPKKKTRYWVLQAELRRGSGMLRVVENECGEEEEKIGSLGLYLSQRRNLKTHNLGHVMAASGLVLPKSRIVCCLAKLILRAPVGKNQSVDAVVTLDRLLAALHVRSCFLVHFFLRSKFQSRTRSCVAFLTPGREPAGSAPLRSNCKGLGRLVIRR